MPIEAASVRPDFAGRKSIPLDRISEVSEPCVIFEAEWLDDDGERCYAYTMGGWLDGKPLGDMRGGVTVGPDVLIVHADSRMAADAMASAILADTIDLQKDEAAAYIDAHAALARLNSVSPTRRLDLATAPDSDKSDAFVEDTEAIRKLRGDDIVLTVGGVEPA